MAVRPDVDGVRRHELRRFSTSIDVVWTCCVVLVVVIVVTTDSVNSHSIRRVIDRRAAVEDRGQLLQPPSAVDWNDVAQKKLQETLASRPNNNVARNVILFLGDGMGVTTVTAGRIYSGQLKGQSGEEYQLAFDKFPNVALAKTYNVDHQVPDSAGTATAFMCGVKANLGVIGVNQNVRRGVCEDMSSNLSTSNNGVDSIVRWSIREGKRTGIVTTTRITHATPSSGYAHSADRDWESDGNVPDSVRYSPLCEDIASQLIANNSDINVLMGGGRSFFLPANGSLPNKGARLDGRNLIEEWKARTQGKSATYVSSKADFDVIDEKRTDYLLGLFNDGHMQFRIEQKEGGTPEPTLAEMTEKAIKILRRGSNGYFLLVEGGRIDHGHHKGTAKLALEEVVGFDEAIQRAVDMTDSSDTLIVVTADHSHVVSVGGYPSRGNPILGLVDQRGFREEPTLDNMPYLTLMYANGPGIANRTNLTGVDTQANWFRQPVNVPLESETHGGEDVAIYASGPMSHLFHGVVEQNYVAHAMAYASCVGSNKAHCDADNHGKSDASGRHGNDNYGSLSKYMRIQLAAILIAFVGTKL